MLLGFDSETYLITPTDKAPKPVVCTWSNGAKRWLTRPGDADTYFLVADPDNVFTGVNIAYDIIAMMRWHPQTIPHWVRALDEGRVLDCTVRECLRYLAEIGAKGYDPRPSLADLAAKYLGLDLSASKQGQDIWRLKYGTLDGVPFHAWPREALDYALDDAAYAYEIFMRQGGPTALMPLEVLQNQSAVVLHAIGTYGIRIDQTIRNALKTSLEQKIAVLDAKIGPLRWTGPGSQARMAVVVMQAWHRKHLSMIEQYAQATGVLFNRVEWERIISPTIDIRAFASTALSNNQIIPCVAFSSPAHNQLAWLQDLINHLPEIPLTSKGPSTAETVLEPIADQVAELKDYFDLKHRQKMLSTYIEPYAHDTIHPSFVNIITTGRTGCRSPNVQNIPRKDKDRPDEAFRTMFRAREGRILGTVDFSQLELCTLAATIRDRFPGIRCQLGDAIDADMDVHCITGSLFSGRPYEEMIAKKKSDPVVADIRQASKAVNFGRPGGLGDERMMEYAKNNYGVQLTLDKAKAIGKAWKQAWPEVVTYLRNNGAQVEVSPTGTVTGYTINGQAKAGLIYTELCNFPFQALAADGAKRALWAIWRECVLGWHWKHYPGQGYGDHLAMGPLADSVIVNFVHDEIVDEHPQGPAGEAALKRQEALMVEEMHKACKRLVKIKVEGKLSEQWEH